MEKTNQMLKVTCPLKNDKTGKTFWIRLGSAYKNRDGSTNVYLDALPTNRTLCIQELSEWDLKRIDEAKSRSASTPAPF